MNTVEFPKELLSFSVCKYDRVLWKKRLLIICTMHGILLDRINEFEKNPTLYNGKRMGLMSGRFMHRVGVYNTRLSHMGFGHIRVDEFAQSYIEKLDRNK